MAGTKHAPGIKRLGGDEAPPYDGIRSAARAASDGLVRGVVDDLEPRFQMILGRIDALKAMHVGLSHRVGELERWPEWMPAQTACEYLGGISTETLRKWAAAHPEPIRRRCGQTVYYKRSEIDAMMAARFVRDDS